MASFERARRSKQTTDAMMVGSMRGGAFFNSVCLGVVGHVCHGLRDYVPLIRESRSFYNIHGP